MTDTEITTIVREYAGEVHNFDYFFENENKRFLTWLTRRFCLVKKNKVEEMYLNAKIAIEKGYDENSGGMMAVGSASKSILESLFPDLGKEME